MADRAAVTLAMAISMAFTSVASEVFSAAEQVAEELEIFLALVEIMGLWGKLIEILETRNI